MATIVCSCCGEPAECPYCGKELERMRGEKRGYTACECATIFHFYPDPLDRSMFLIEEIAYPERRM